MTTNREFLEALKEEVKRRGTGGYYSARSVQDIDALVSAMSARFPAEPDAARGEREESDRVRFVLMTACIIHEEKEGVIYQEVDGHSEPRDYRWTKKLLDGKPGWRKVDSWRRVNERAKDE